MSPSSFIDPSSLAMASPSPSYASRSPSPPHHDAPSTSSAPQPPRKRARTELTSEERKEARAHRNRIAAQNSRDRRKAQFGYLERRVAELEEENRRLRAGLPMPPPPQPINVAPAPHLTALPTLASLASVAASAAAGMTMRSPEEEARIRRDQERERENEELKERIKTLERGWDAVVKALAAQGLPTGLSTTTNNDSPSTSNTASSSSPSSSKPSSSSTTHHNSQPSSSLATTPSPTSPSSANHSLSLNGFAAFPSPAPSHSSLDVNELDVSTIPASTPFALQPSIHTQPLPSSTVSPGIATSPVSATVSVPSIEKNSTRHLARVATIEPSGLMSLQRPSKAGFGSVTGYLPSPSITDDDDDFGCDEDAKMEDLFREIFVESAAPAVKEEASKNAGLGLQDAAVADGALWRGDASQAQVGAGVGNVGEDGQVVEGPSSGEGLGESGESVQQPVVVVGGKRKREEEEEVQVPTTSTMSDEEMQRMLSEMEVSMMLGNFDPALTALPIPDNYGPTLDMGLLGFTDGTDATSFVDFASSPDFGGMWASTNSTATVPGVF